MQQGKKEKNQTKPPPPLLKTKEKANKNVSILLSYRLNKAGTSHLRLTVLSWATLQMCLSMKSLAKAERLPHPSQFPWITSGSSNAGSLAVRSALRSHIYFFCYVSSHLKIQFTIDLYYTPDLKYITNQLGHWYSVPVNTV